MPVAEWKRAFKAVPGARVCRSKPALANVAAVFGEDKGQKRSRD